jgi:hypothetical protein
MHGKELEDFLVFEPISTSGNHEKNPNLFEATGSPPGHLQNNKTDPIRTLGMKPGTEV